MSTVWLNKPLENRSDCGFDENFDNGTFEQFLPSRLVFAVKDVSAMSDTSDWPEMVDTFLTLLRS